MGPHSFGDPQRRDDFEQVEMTVDARDAHWYRTDRTRDRVAFCVDERLVKVVGQSPAYPMQLMPNIYEFAAGPEPASPLERYPKELVVERLRGWRSTAGRGGRADVLDGPDGPDGPAGPDGFVSLICTPGERNGRGCCHPLHGQHRWEEPAVAPRSPEGTRRAAYHIPLTRCAIEKNAARQDGTGRQGR